MSYPDDWSQSALQDIATLARGKFSARPRNDPKYFGGEYPFVQTGDVRNASVTLKNYSQTLNEAGLRVSKMFPKGTLLFTIAANIGEVAFLGFDGACPDSLIAIHPKPDTSESWLYYQLGFLQPAFEAAATQNAQLNINLEKLNPFIVPVPPFSEQRAIAEALSDADALIEGLERLIAKKRLIKQGAMQDLLTAKRRLPGFSGEWVRCALSDLGEISGSGVDKKIVGGERSVRLLNYTDVYREGYITGSMLSHWVTASEVKARRCQIRNGDIFFTPTSETPDDIARSSVSLEDISDAAYSYHVVRLRLNEPDSPGFWAHVFEIEDFRGQTRRNADGSGTRYVITLPKFRAMQVNVPPKPERAAIGSVLRDMDAEIQALETRLEKARQIKEGMMQNLLTGRIRLV